MATQAPPPRTHLYKPALEGRGLQNQQTGEFRTHPEIIMMQKKIRTNGFCTNWVCILLGLLCLGTTTLRAGEPKFYAVMVTAQVQSSPAQITLQWSGDGSATGYQISRNNGSGWSEVGS